MPFVHLSPTVPRSTDPLHLSGNGISLSSLYVPPLARPASPPSSTYVFRDRSARPAQLAGLPGATTADRFTAAGQEIVRRVWVAAAGDAAAVQVRLRNTGSNAMRLDAIHPLRSAGDDLLIEGHGAGDWEAIVHKRLKNGIPAAIRVGVQDDDFAHVSRGATETGGLAGDDGARIDLVEADPCILLRSGGTVLLLGFLSQTGHCARFLLRTTGESLETVLHSLDAQCEFDGTLLPPGGERTSQWVWLRAGQDPNALLDDFADRVGSYHGVSRPPSPPPTVHCSWQFYGADFTEKDFHEDLASLASDPVPFDVFLIDDCWSFSRGDWWPNDLWSSGMADAAHRIVELGYRPGIWTCPLMVNVASRVAEEHPGWLLRLEDGSPHIFPMGGPNYALDPTYPGVCDHIERMFRRLTHDWGFTYHKLDFMRCVFVDARIRFHDPTATRLEAYRRGLEAVRHGAGPDAYISVCGGHYGGSLGLADSQRSGSDVAAMWDDPPALPKFKQNILRTWMSRLWHVDPDAMMVRRREIQYHEGDHGFLSLGKFTDEEARTIAVNQYIGGGLVCICEKWPEIDADRRALYRHVIPAIGSPGMPLDPYEPLCPSLILTRVAPKTLDLEPWVTVSVTNWTDEARTLSVPLDDIVLDTIETDRLLVFEFFDQVCLGLFSPGEVIDLGDRPPHTSRVLRIAPWPGDRPVLAGTGLHFSGGGVEIVGWRCTDDGVTSELATDWRCPVTVTAAFPATHGPQLASTVIEPGATQFEIQNGI